MSFTLNPFSISVDGEFRPFDVVLMGTDGEFTFTPLDSDIITDHDKRAAALLIEQFENSEKLQSFVKALTKQANEVERMFFNLKHERNISNGDGVQLDKIGELVGEPRNGRDDDDYRQALLLRPNINRSYGEGEMLILVLSQLVKASKIILIEQEPKTVNLFFKTTSPIPSNLQESIEAVADAGAKIHLSYIDDGEEFVFATEGGFPDQSNTSGFGETGSGNELEGGKFTEIIT